MASTAAQNPVASSGVHRVSSREVPPGRAWNCPASYHSPSSPAGPVGWTIRPGEGHYAVAKKAEVHQGRRQCRGTSEGEGDGVGHLGGGNSRVSGQSQ
jgi:hypothetical protein